MSKALIVSCPVSAAEREVLDTLRSLTAITSDGNVLRLGLVHLARHLDVPIDVTIFAQRSRLHRFQKRGKRGPIKQHADGRDTRRQQLGRMLARGHRLTLMQVARRLGMRKATANGLLFKLVKEGYLERVENRVGVSVYRLPTAAPLAAAGGA